MTPDRVLETCLYVDDLELAEVFYSRLFGFELFAKVAGRHVFFRCGQGMFLLFNPEATRIDSGLGLPTHGATGPGHAAFAMKESEIATWRDRLDAHNIPIECEYSWPAGGFSIYFRDPAGNSIELATPGTWGLDA